MRKSIRIITKKQFFNESCEMSEEMRKSIQNNKMPFIMEVKVPCKDEPLGWYWFSCGFTPWRLFVKNSKYYKARIEPENNGAGKYWKEP